MQAAVQSLANYWNARDCAIGFGVGIAMGPATVGTLGWHGRLDYTAIGNVVNLASRLCDLADNAQILVDPVVTGHVKDSIALASIGQRGIKGYDRAREVFAVVRSVGPLLCRIWAVRSSLPTFDPLKRDQGDERRNFLRQMPAEFGQQGCAPSEESFSKTVACVCRHPFPCPATCIPGFDRTSRLVIDHSPIDRCSAASAAICYFFRYVIFVVPMVPLNANGALSK